MFSSAPFLRQRQDGWPHFLGLSCSAVSCRTYCASLNGFLIARERECNSNSGTILIGQEDRQQCMSGPIVTECARTARKRTIGALVFVRLCENLEESLDNKLLLATLPHETTEKGRISQENGECRFCTDLAVGEPMVRRRFALSSCLLLL